MIVKKYLTHNGNLIQRGANKFIYRNYDKPGPVIPYVKIGNQTWMAESLKEDDGITGIWTHTNVNINGIIYPKLCYYTYEAAVRIAQTIPGWRLPTKNDVDTLVQYVNSGNYGSTLAMKMKATSGWGNNGTDDYGWNALPIGKEDPYIGYNTGGEYTIWQQEAYRWYVTNDNRSQNGQESHNYGFAVRLIKDS